VRYLFAVSPFLLLIAPLVVNAAEYPKGHRALEVFDAQGMEATPPWVMAWIVASTICFVAGLCFVRRHSVARWVLGCYAAGFAVLVASAVFDSDQLRLAGFNALIHVLFWPPALFQLLTKRPFLDKPVTAFSIWSGLITGIILFSYIFDIPYSATYLKHVFMEH